MDVVQTEKHRNSHKKPVNLHPEISNDDAVVGGKTFSHFPTDYGKTLKDRQYLI